MPRADRPDLLAVDPALAPLFHQAVLLAAELGITLYKVAMMPSEGLRELVSERAEQAMHSCDTNLARMEPL